MDYELNDNENHQENENENEENRNPAQFFKVTPDDYTESDSNTIIDFDEDEDSKTQNQIEDQNQEQNQASEHHEEYLSREAQENGENEEQNFHDENEQHEEQESKNEMQRGDEENHENAEGEHEPHTNEEEHEGEGEKENQDDNEEEENNGITDPNVKQLMKMDMADKDGIIDLLMKDNLVKKSDVKNEKIIKEKNRAKFGYVESTIGKKPIGHKKISYGRKGFQIVPEEGNPEFIKDMNIAAYAIKDQVEEENQDVAKILFDENSGQKINKRITREQIDEKVKKTLEKKKKNLEKIEAQMYEQQKTEETFTPVINHRKGENRERRNLNKFLRDQNNFSKKIQKKREELINQKKKQNNLENVGKPKVDKNSEELAKKLNNTEEPAYLRLYKKRTLEKERIAEKEKLLKERRKEEENKRKEKLNENKKLYGHIQSKINMGQKKEAPAVDKFGNIENKKNKENIEKEKEIEKEREKIIQKKMKKKKGKLLEVKDIPTNKMLFNNFEKKFEEAISSIANENLTETDVHNLLFNLGMISNLQKKEGEGENKEENKEEKKEENNEEKNEEKFNIEDKLPESPIQQEEKQLLNELIKSIKNNQNEINKDDIKNFIICILGIQKYVFYQRFKSQHEPELKELFPINKYKKEDIPELMILKENKDILSKVDKNSEKNNKYSYHSNDGKIYISLEKGHSIKKDFSIFALNYRNSKKPSKEAEKEKHKKQFNFKPTINENSEKLYQKYIQDKVVSVQNEQGEGGAQAKDPHMEYIERILLHDKKRIAETQKVKEELEKKELKECTFKPKINQGYVNKNTKKEKEKNSLNNVNTNMNNEKKNRVVELYEKGTADIKKKKDKTSEEMEVEKQIKECTFHPNIKIEEKIPETRFTNDIHREKEYRNLYERLKKGRMERKVKESAHDRYDLNKELKNYVKQSKENRNREYLEEEKFQEDYSENNNIIRSSKMKTEKNESNKKNMSANKNEDDNYNNSMEQSSEDDGEKKEGIPLLIIDVNIRQGVKKKIYVYEGDTPEGLAEKFAKEHNLEEETKIKLENLIHNHMVRLLTRIEEENQSISEKSQATQGKKK